MTGLGPPRARRNVTGTRDAAPPPPSDRLRRRSDHAAKPSFNECINAHFGLPQVTHAVTPFTTSSAFRTASGNSGSPCSFTCMMSWRT